MSYLVLFLALSLLARAARGHGYLRNVHHGVLQGGFGEGVRGDLVDKLTVLMIKLDFVQLMDILAALEPKRAAIARNLA